MPAITTSASAAAGSIQLFPRGFSIGGSSGGISGGSIALIVCIGIVPVLIVAGVVIWGLCIHGRNEWSCARRRKLSKHRSVHDGEFQDSSSDTLAQKNLPAPPAKLVKSFSDSTQESRYSQASTIAFEPESPRSPPFTVKKHWRHDSMDV